MKTKIFAISMLSAALLLPCLGNEPGETEFSLKNTFGDKFLIGAALNTRQSFEQDKEGVKILKQHFNSIVAENCMKSALIHPKEDQYNFFAADSFVNFGEANNMAIIGHCLIWHSQCPPWFFVNENGETASPELLKQRMKDHITTVVSRYKGRVKGWDVVNEAIVEDGSYRKSKFYEILGEEFIPLAFQYAHDADPNAELYYNDYGMTVPGRRDAVIKMVNSLKERGIRIDAIGMQGHMDMYSPSVEQFEESILAFAGTGCKVMVTEWDMSVLPFVRQGADVSIPADEYRKKADPYTEGLPDEVSDAWNARMKEFFEMFEKHSDVITRVTVWGLTDGDSWKNYFPVRGRTDYPLLFDRNYEPKPFVREIILRGGQRD